MPTPEGLQFYDHFHVLLEESIVVLILDAQALGTLVSLVAKSLQLGLLTVHVEFACLTILGHAVGAIGRTISHLLLF